MREGVEIVLAWTILSVSIFLTRGTRYLNSKHFFLFLSLLYGSLLLLVICSWQHAICFLTVCSSGQGLACGSYWCIYSCGNIWRVVFPLYWKTKKNEKGKWEETLLFLKQEARNSVAGDRQRTQWDESLLPLSVYLSLSGKERSIVCPMRGLLSRWASGTNLNINSNIRDRIKWGRASVRLKAKYCALVNAVGFHQLGGDWNCIIQGMLMSRQQVLVQRK